MVAEYGSLMIILPYALITALGVVFIMIAMRDKKPPSLPNLTARRKHPLRHLQVELNKAKETGRAKQGDAQPEEKKSEEKPRRRRRRDGPGGPGGLRRVR